MIPDLGTVSANSRASPFTLIDRFACWRLTIGAPVEQCVRNSENIEFIQRATSRRRFMARWRRRGTSVQDKVSGDVAHALVGSSQDGKATAGATNAWTAREPHVATSINPADEIKTTTCYMCACRCGIQVHLKDGKVRSEELV